MTTNEATSYPVTEGPITPYSLAEMLSPEGVKKELKRKLHQHQVEMDICEGLAEFLAARKELIGQARPEIRQTGPFRRRVLTFPLLSKFTSKAID